MLTHFCKGLAFAFLAGPWTADALAARGQLAVADERPAPWLRSVVGQLMNLAAPAVIAIDP